MFKPQTSKKTLKVAYRNKEESCRGSEKYLGQFWEQIRQPNVIASAKKEWLTAQMYFTIQILRYVHSWHNYCHLMQRLKIKYRCNNENVKHQEITGHCLFGESRAIKYKYRSQCKYQCKILLTIYNRHFPLEISLTLIISIYIFTQKSLYLHNS